MTEKQKRTRNMGFKVTPTECIELIRLAASSKMSLSDYIRGKVGLENVEDKGREKEPYEYRAQKAGYK